MKSYGRSFSKMKQCEYCGNNFKPATGKEVIQRFCRKNGDQCRKRWHRREGRRRNGRGNPYQPNSNPISINQDSFKFTNPEQNKQEPSPLNIDFSGIIELMKSNKTINENEKITTSKKRAPHILEIILDEEINKAKSSNLILSQGKVEKMEEARSLIIKLQKSFDERIEKESSNMFTVYKSVYSKKEIKDKFDKAKSSYLKKIRNHISMGLFHSIENTINYSYFG